MTRDYTTTTARTRNKTSSSGQFWPPTSHRVRIDSILLENVVGFYDYPFRFLRLPHSNKNGWNMPWIAPFLLPSSFSCLVSDPRYHWRHSRVHETYFVFPWNMFDFGQPKQIKRPFNATSCNTPSSRLLSRVAWPNRTMLLPSKRLPSRTILWLLFQSNDQSKHKLPQNGSPKHQGSFYACTYLTQIIWYFTVYVIDWWSDGRIPTSSLRNKA